MADLTGGPVCAAAPTGLARLLKAKLPVLAANTVDAVPHADPTACLREAKSPARSDLSGFSHILVSYPGGVIYVTTLATLVDEMQRGSGDKP